MPRFIRGSNTVLSNHAFGSAFDIDVAFNGLSVEPALLGKRDRVRELVATANEHVWGVDFNGRRDRMY